MTEFKDWISTVTDKGYRLRVLIAPGNVVIMVQEKLVAMGADNEAPTQTRWFTRSQVALWLPAGIGELERAAAHWCSYYDPDLTELAVVALAPLRSLPNPVEAPDEPPIAPPQGPLN